MLTVWLAKFDKSRHVPLSPSTVAALGRYAAQRPPATPAAPGDVRRRSGQRLTYPRFAPRSRTLLDTSDRRGRAGRRPRVHDLRHSFAVTTLLGWYRDGADVQALLPRLSTYLGHVDPGLHLLVSDRRPELMALAAERLDRRDEEHRSMTSLAPTLESFFTERLYRQRTPARTPCAPTATRSGCC